MSAASVPSRPSPGLLVRQAREDVGLSQRAAARVTGVQQSHLSQIEAGRRPVSAAMLQRILDRLRMRPSVPLSLEADAVRSLAVRWGLDHVRVVGSVARGEDDERSDIDLLVGIGPDTTVFDLNGFAQDAGDLLGARVDVIPDLGDDKRVRAMRSEAVPL